MKKTFPLQMPGRDDARVRDKIRHEVNKAVRRARQRPLPDGFDTLEFSCRVGLSEANAESQPLKEIAGIIDAVAATGATQIFIEILPVPALRRPPV